MRRLLVLFLLLAAAVPTYAQPSTVTVGSKRFTESYVLGEIAKKLLTDAGYSVEHKQGVGGTIVVWQALKSGAVSCYPEYTGTIGEEILKAQTPLTREEMAAGLAKFGVKMTGELGFNNTYALVMRRDTAQKLGVKTISDLQAHPDLRVRVTPEFLARKDGWKPLSAHYQLTMKDVTGVEHALGYAGLESRQADVKDAYSTDAKIAENDLVVLEDDRKFFPEYKAVFLYRQEMPQKAVEALKKLEGTLSDTRMTALNAVAEQSKDYPTAAAQYFVLEEENQETRQNAAASTVAPESPDPADDPADLVARLAGWTGRHLYLVGVSLLLAMVVGVPLGILASQPGVLSQGILGVVGLIQTIPSLALLTLLIPVPGLGISPQTAIVALFLYSLLPIVRNTATGLQDIPAGLRESAAALGLEPGAQLTRVLLPMASRTILAGIKTSAIINIGTATLAALIGAGGLGEPIVSGLNLNDEKTILLGAIPAALLAVLAQFLFEGLDRLLIPRGLRLQASLSRNSGSAAIPK